ncbi:hypothetical protein C923_03175 [Plasmodium falciparum UGT5.1]|uniref:ZF-HD dimerization-type domain-containing protein n=1 Tax=Plasmodium falciparum UGT5.1 TaxID=1237627 RepID=W7JMM4_PLAFA|nr:hypothetical protein C923_03175 [Plasmodium falciparum UGT5.1]
MAPTSGGESARDVLEEYGEKIQQQATINANPYKKYLRANLEEATYPKDEKAIGTTPKDPCQLVEYYYNKRVNKDGGGNGNPCKELSGKTFENPFSDTLGGQCTDSKMRSDGIGACAPYRRLHLCHHNLEKITDTTSMTTHDLLLEVCMAAKYEGNSIKTYYPQHQHKYRDSQLCTVLARSFADIGDIVRGRDPFYGNPQEKDQRKQLDKNLKKIFAKIHKKLVKKNGAKELQERYQDTKNYFQLREDWWNANRQQVWKALTCDAPESAQYFRHTCGSGKTATQGKCRCNDDQVPTYFDYVPQFLRWFEEWAEDFCRLRKHKLEDAKNKCRGKNGEEKYCDLNRYDCEKTASGEKKFVEGAGCKDCHFSCAHFVKWIDNQKLEFLKQKEKYETEISVGGGGSAGGSRRQKRSTKSETYEGYDKDFYDILKKSAYNNVDKFLEKLNEEDVCTKNNEIEEGGQIDFKTVNSGSAKKGDDSNKTFYRTTYCEACPWCGAKKVNGQNGKGKWTAKKETCESAEKKIYNDQKKTNIPILTGDNEKFGIYEKYSKFCESVKNTANGATPTANGGGQIKKWECYYESVNNDNCVQGEWKDFKKDQKVTSYNAFFWDWVHDMLHDSVEWKTELSKCINNNTNGKTCKKNKCNDKCKCYESWAQQKEKEWGNIKNHFGKQDFVSTGPLGKFGYDFVLKYVLDKKELLQNIKDTHVDADDIKRIEALLKETGVDASGGASGGRGGVGGSGGENKNTKIDKFLREELDDATKCKNCQEPQQSLGRSLNPRVVDDDDSPKKRDKRTNPCYSDATTEYDVLAEKVAETLQVEAQKQLDRNGSRNALRSDASKGEYRKRVKPQELSNICKISDDHSNDERNTGEPCTGKDKTRFDIGTEWKHKTEINMTDEYAYMPPRREHMCTSNLENLDVGDVTNNGNVNDTFLGNVLLEANYEAKKIKDVYQENMRSRGQNEKNGLNNEKTVCRAIRYSFADLGDIIRGRDLYLGDKGEKKKLEEKLKKYFKKIHSGLSNNGVNSRYKDPKGDFFQLREDWWEANREKVWEAMKYHIKDFKVTSGDKSRSSHCGYSDHTPLDDYIPQRLRWMTEWAEWFCKMQSQEYENLETQCMTCKNNRTKCTQGDNDCTTCDKQCKLYGEKIKKWRKQWEQMYIKYTLSYLEAKHPHTGFVFGDASPDYQLMVDFLTQLIQQSDGGKDGAGNTTVSPTNPNTPYETAAGYIHQELWRTVGCDTQTKFCFGDNNYAFKETPHEYEVACKCKERPQQEDKSAARADLSPRAPSAGGDESENDESEDDLDEGEEEEEEEEEKKEPEENVEDGKHNEEEEETREDVQEESQEPDTGSSTEEGSPPTDDVKVCETVEEALKDDLSEACKQKYQYGKEKFPNWKCIPSGNNTTTSSGSGNTTSSSGPTSGGSGDTTGSSGSICVPPRRRKLYVGGLTKWADKVGNTETQSQAGDSSQGNGVSTSPAPTSASTSSPSPKGDALLTAFVESAAVETFFLWDRYKKEKKPQGVGAGLGLSHVQEVSPPSENPQTLLQTGVIPPEFLRQMFYTLGDYRDILFSGDKDEKSSTYNDIINGDKEIQEREKTIKEKITNFFQNGDKNPKTLWQTFGPSIWEGMVCALAYNTDTRQVDPKVKKALLEKGTPQSNGQQDYTYEKVVLKEDKNSGENTPLSKFVERPPYFRYLEEWGETFCKKRKGMLENIKKECMKDRTIGSTGKKVQKCSCYGEDCEDNLPENPSTFKDILCPGCGRHCSFYKKWIKIKKDEYEKQKEIYKEQKRKVEKNNGFCTKLKENCTDAEAFLNRLKNGPCKKENGKDNQEDEIDFGDVNGKTFQHTEYCAPCSEFKINCKENGKCKSSLNEKCQGKITVDRFDTMGEEPQEVVMRVSDSNTTGFGDLNEACEHANIFEGIKENKWECRKVCGYVVCKPEQGNENENKSQILLFNALLKRWVEYFLEDYKKIKHKISHCTKTDQGSTCQNKCENKCKCVEKWIEKKRTEWKEIKERFNEQYKSNGSHDDNVRSVLETMIPKIAAANGKENVTQLSDLDALEKSLGCNCANHSHKSENSEKSDIIDCMLNKLEEKAKKCEEKHQASGENKNQECVDSSTPVEEDEEEELLEEDEQNTVGKQQPSFCPQTPAQPEDEDACKAATTAPEETASPPADSPPVKPAQAPAEPPAAPIPRPQPQPPTQLLDDPLLKTALMSSTIMWSIGIGFAAFTYFYLKKKTKSSVGNLFQILHIPKSDYDIPTKLSPNRYIPYTSGKYRGKRYIYLEGDSGTDSGYTDHYSDITSSSESEYEELDINDIYAPRAPKYKTLIEVVLEPSGNNTTASGNNTPSDTQNDIQSDDIPHSNKFTDNEWNTLKDEFISNMLQGEPKDVPNDYKSGDIPFNTQPNTLYFDKPEEKPFIMSIHDRDLYSGEEYNYNINMSTNSMDDPKHVSNNVYSGIDLINDALNGDYDIYDEMLKRKENELFGTNHVKQTSIHSVAKLTNSDPIHNQLELFHKWLDRHRDMCEKWENHHERLAKLKEEWENETHSGNTHPSDSNKTLNTDVSIQIHMDNPKPINEFTNMDTYPNNSSMDTILDDLDKYNDPYYDVQDDIYYDVNDHDASTVDTNAMDIPSKVQIEMDVNTKLVKEKYPISDVWDI